MALHLPYYPMRILVLIILLSATSVLAQINPPNNAELNFTQVMFEYPPVDSAAYYVVSLKEDGTGTNSRAPLELEQTDSTSATLISELTFGKSYTWNVTAYHTNGEPIVTSSDYTFKIKMSEYVRDFRFRLNKRYTGDVNDGVIFLDYCRVAIDRKGRPVWFFPRPEVVPDKIDIRDTKLTDAGYITMLPQPNGLVMTLDGRILWRTPKEGVISNTNIEFHHHALLELDNGNYMTLSKRYVDKELFGEEDTTYKVGYSTILEYTPDGELVWSWSSEGYLKDEDLDKQTVLDKLKENETYCHANGFSFDQENGVIYLSFRDLSSIIKIDYKTGEVVESYGYGPDSWEDSYADNEFMRQHSPVLLDGNALLFFNNNDTTRASIIRIMSVAEGTQGQTLWEFSCDFDHVGNGNSFKMGSVQQMDNGNILTCMGYNPRIFEVSPAGDVVWDGVPEVNIDGAGWKIKENYRVWYATSLYPTYFTVQKIDGGLKIVNEGSESDVYSIALDGSFFETLSLEPGEQTMVPIANCESTCEVIVSSGNNKFYSRSVNFLED